MTIVKSISYKFMSGADPGFPVGGRGPPMWVLFGENERIKFGGGRACAGKFCM